MTDKSWNDYPHLLADLDMTKNKNHLYKGNPIDVLELLPGTSKKLDWKCSTCSHDWKTTGKHRVNGTGCPACSGRSIHSDGRNSMAMTHPHIAVEYPGDATKVIAGTHNKLDWKCITCDHEWCASAKSRSSVRGTGCPACAGRIHSDGRNSMINTHPDLAKEYQGDANLIVAGTGKKLAWKCSTCEHEWNAVGVSRVNECGCPACYGYLHSDGRNSMSNTHPQLAIEYQGDANSIIAGTGKKLAWKCSTCEHEWLSSGSNRVNGTGCSACINRTLHSDGQNSMANTHPELAVEYQGDANLIVAGTNKRLKWKCNTCENEWITTGNSRCSMETGCAHCIKGCLHSDGRNSLFNTHSQLAIEYQGDANLIIASTMKKLDWKCITCEHEWASTGDNRVRGEKGCPACANLAINNYDGRNSMAQTHPLLAMEYQGDANLLIMGTHRGLDWKCSICEYEWNSVGYSRVSGSGCAQCAKTGYDPSQIGYVYIHQYVDDTTHWLKCGITGKPVDRFKQLSRAASRVNIEVQQLDIYTFDDGWIAQQCERELLDTSDLRFNSEYDIDGKAEFFKYSALDDIKNIIEKYL